MDLGLSDKVALVTAASRGLGRACAEELAREGARIVLVARGEADLTTAARDIANQTGADVLPLVADLSSSSDLRRSVDVALTRHGRIDVLVSNCGGPPAGRFETHDFGAWQAAIDLVLRSAVELARAVLPGMRQRKWGRIVNITSISVKQPVDGLMLSNSIRAAVTGFARTLANEVAADGITVNNVLPGYTRTERVEQLARSLSAAEGTTPQIIEDRWTAQIPMGRIGEPAELAAAVAFLASARASYITGTSITIDGGWVRSLL